MPAKVVFKPMCPQPAHTGAGHACLDEVIGFRMLMTAAYYEDSAPLRYKTSDLRHILRPFHGLACSGDSERDA